MATLPTVGADTDNWGTELNAYLLVAHDANGAHTFFFNVKDSTYGAKGDNSTDDTSALQAALDAANAAGGGTVYIPRGTYITGTLKTYSNVHVRGAGIGATVIKLKAGTNADVFWGGSTNAGYINLGAGFGVGQVSGANVLQQFGFYDLTIDGNKANQSSASNGIRVYGFGYILQNITVRNCYSDGILSDWNGGSNSPGADSMEAFWVNVKTHDNGNRGVALGGPHDSKVVNLICYLNGTENLHVAPNATGSQFTSSHFWAPAQVTSTSPGVLVESDVHFVNCQAEGAPGVNVAMLAWGITYYGGRIFGDTEPNSTIGVQFGQSSGGTPWPNEINQSGGLTTSVGVAHCQVDTKFDRCGGGAYRFESTSGYNTARGHHNLTSGVAFAGTPASTDAYWLTTDGLTSDGSFGKAGGYQFPSSAFSGMLFPRPSDGKLAASINPGSLKLDMPHNSELRLWSDGFTTQKASVNGDGNGSIWSQGYIAVGQSSSAASIASSGTITTSGVGAARVTTSGAVTGVIMQAGTQAGQQCIVVNESANSLTMAAAATSRVADGTSCVIAANRAMWFVWDSSVSRWFHS